MYNKEKRASYRARAVIDNCPDEDYCELNLNWVSKKIDVSDAHLSRSFKQDFDCNIKDYIEVKKLEKAAELLVETDMEVKAIAAFLDYTNPGYFSRKFSDHWKLPPGMYRTCNQFCFPPWDFDEDPGPYKPFERPEPVEPEGPIETGNEEKEEPILEILKKRFIKYIKKKLRQ